MVGSTQLSGQLDPEDLQELIGAYYEVCDRAVNRYAGHVAQYLGDGVLVYFGFPQAHEDDPIRALRAALEIVQELEVERPNIERRWDCTLSVRIGVHTGPVVVGEIGAGDGRQQLAMGETTNIAARLQGFAPVDGIVASDKTLSLTGDKFKTMKLEGLSLRGVLEPMDGAEVHAYAPAARHVADHVSVLPLVGRSKEYGQLIEALDRARAGSGGTVLVTGEPGIGKSRLVDELRESQFQSPIEGWLTLQCVAHDATRPFGPVIESLRHVLPEGSPALDVDMLRDVLVAAGDATGVGLELLAQHFGFTVPQDQTGKWLPELRRRRTIEWFSKLLYGCLGAGPGILVVEDLHWADTSTLDLVTDLGDRTPELSRLLVLTARPEFSGAYDAPRGFTHLALEGLSEEATGQLIHYVARGRKIAPELVRAVAERSDGVPLFTEQVARNLLERGDNLDRGPSLTAVPGSLHDLLNARLDRLGEAREVAQRLSVVGRSFSPAWIEMICGDISDLAAKLSELEHADLLVRTAGMLSFKHALVQEAAYQTLLRRDRRRFHARCAKAFAEDTDGVAHDQPSLIAHHWTEAGDPVKAVDAWIATATHARGRGAINESNVAIDRGLALLDGIADIETRDECELGLRSTLNTVLIAKGGPGTNAFIENNIRGLELLRSEHDPRNVYLRMAISMSHMLHSRLDEAEAMCQEGLGYATRLHEPVLQGFCHSSGMRIAAYRGDFESVFERTRLADEVWPENFPHLTGAAVAAIPVDAAIFRSLALWHSGMPDSALAESKRALELAHAVKTPREALHTLR